MDTATSAHLLQTALSDRGLVIIQYSPFKALCPKVWKEQMKVYSLASYAPYVHTFAAHTSLHMFSAGLQGAALNTRRSREDMYARA